MLACPDPKPVISVIIPTYNRAAFLGEAVASVLAQDYFLGEASQKKFELIIVDDGSTDSTRRLVRSFGDSVHYYFQMHKGVSAARNFGLRVARGEYIAFLDSDDLWDRRKISLQMSFMRACPTAQVSYTEETWIRRGVVVNPKKKHQKYSGWIFERVLPLCLLSLSSALFRREVFGEVGVFDESLPACEDYDFAIRVSHRYPINLITRPLIIKRGGHPDQLSSKFWGLDRFRVRALQKALTLDLSPDQERMVCREIVRKCQVLVSGFQKRHKHQETHRYQNLIRKFTSRQEET